jgi:hypothetical protein
MESSKHFKGLRCSAGFDHSTASGLKTGHKAACTVISPTCNQLAPGWQKPRHASLLSASDKSCFKEINLAVGTSVVQQRLLTLTAGPLVLMIY